MSISPLNSVNPNTSARQKMKINTVTATGYAALGAGAASAIAGFNKKIKPHKYLAYLAGIFAIAHTGIIEFYKFRHSKKDKTV